MHVKVCKSACVYELRIKQMFLPAARFCLNSQHVPILNLKLFDLIITNIKSSFQHPPLINNVSNNVAITSMNQWSIYSY